MELGLLLYGIIVLLIAGAAAVGLIIFIVGSVREDKRSSLTKTGGVIAVVFGLLFFILNSSGSSEITSDVEGTYKIQYPTGHVELLSINNDHSFAQTIYSNAANFDDNKALFQNKGTWTTSEDQLHFNHWLTICYLARNIDSIVPNPEIISLTQVHWYEATSGHPDLIDIWSENGYVLRKIGPAKASEIGPAKASENGGEIEGTYKFIYPTGQVEILSIKNDKTYNQTIFPDENSFTSNSNALFNNNGAWWNPGSGGLAFDNWLVYCKFRDPNKIQSNPHRERMMNVTWHGMTSEHKELLSVCPETGYIFEKLIK